MIFCSSIRYSYLVFALCMSASADFPWNQQFWHVPESLGFLWKNWKTVLHFHYSLQSRDSCWCMLTSHSDWKYMNAPSWVWGKRSGWHGRVWATSREGRKQYRWRKVYWKCEKRQRVCTQTAGEESFVFFLSLCKMVNQNPPLIMTSLSFNFPLLQSTSLNCKSWDGVVFHMWDWFHILGNGKWTVTGSVHFCHYY